MTGTFDDWTYGEEPAALPSLEQALADIAPARLQDAPVAVPEVTPPTYEQVKKAKEATGEKVGPDEIRVVAAHKRERREQEAEEAALQARKQAHEQYLNGADVEEIHAWTLVALLEASEATDPQEKARHYDDARSYLRIAWYKTNQAAKAARKAEVAPFFDVPE